MHDEAGFVAFYRDAYPRLVAAVLPVVGNRAEAEDVAQEAFARCAGRWATVSRFDDPQAWVRRVAYNLAVSTLRTARRRASLLLRRATARPPAAADPVDSIVLVEALQKLPMHYRTVLTLHYLVDLSVEQVGEELSLPLATVRTRLARGRRRLAELLTEGHPSQSTEAHRAHR